jgi:predicted nucleotidyltransferase
MMTIATETDLPQLIDLRDNLLSRLPSIIQRIVMYGSYARGEAEEDSDVDVLVIVDDSSPSVVEEMRTARYEVMEQYQYSPLLSMLILSSKEWRGLSKRSAGLKHNIEKEGVTIWSKI